MVCTLKKEWQFDMFSNPHEALTKAMEEKPNVIFLNVQILGNKGIAIAREIKEAINETHIIFVTENPSYAVQAFEVGATDYIVLPVQHQRLENMFSRFSEGSESRESLYREIHCFNHLSFSASYLDEEKSIKWRTKKAQELFAFLLHRRHDFTRKDVLVDLLWPNMSWKQGITLLYSTMYQVRKLLKDIDFPVEIINTENQYKLQLDNIVCDVEEWERTTQSLPSISAENSEKYVEVIKAYSGDYLAQESYHWAEIERQRLQTKWLSIVEVLSQFYWKHEKFYELARIHYHVQKACPTNENSYIYLMKLYDKLGDHKSVSMIYHSLKEMLKEEYAVKVRPEIVEWYDKRANG